MKSETKELLRNSVIKGYYAALGTAYWIIMGIGILIGLIGKGIGLAITFAILAAAGWWLFSWVFKKVWMKKVIK
ncbi:MAG TPA: hypothetical protein VLG50_03740 [Candidatus Saccharimonadales bacterium]|nr:hypothetical protein [Candidatus Saccharimonadales bacterium]